MYSDSKCLIYLYYFCSDVLYKTLRIERITKRIHAGNWFELGISHFNDCVIRYHLLFFSALGRLPATAK